MAPILTKNYNIEGLYQYTTFFLKLVHFGIRHKVLKNTDFSPKEERIL